jgi:DNA-binding response OmpR family regulator
VNGLRNSLETWGSLDLTAGPVRIDLRDRRVSVDECPVELSAVEYRLLCHLAGEPTRVLTKVNFEL